METTFVHFKLHVGLVLVFSMDHEHLVFAVACDSTLLDQVTQSYDVGYGIVAVPNVILVAFHSGFVHRNPGWPN